MEGVAHSQQGTHQQFGDWRPAVENGRHQRLVLGREVEHGGTRAGCLRKDKGWHDYSLDWPIPAGAVRAELSFGLHEATGEVDFAEFEVVPLQ
jgi:hypothetical protein